MQIERLLDAFLEAMMGFASLPAEPGMPERNDATLSRQRVAELEHEIGFHPRRASANEPADRSLLAPDAWVRA